MTRPGSHCRNFQSKPSPLKNTLFPPPDTEPEPIQSQGEEDGEGWGREDDDYHHDGHSQGATTDKYHASDTDFSSNASSSSDAKLQTRSESDGERSCSPDAEQQSGTPPGTPSMPPAEDNAYWESFEQSYHDDMPLSNDSPSSSSSSDYEQPVDPTHLPIGRRGNAALQSLPDWLTFCETQLTIIHPRQVIVHCWGGDADKDASTEWVTIKSCGHQYPWSLILKWWRSVEPSGRRRNVCMNCAAAGEAKPLFKAIYSSDEMKEPLPLQGSAVKKEKSTPGNPDRDTNKENDDDAVDENECAIIDDDSDEDEAMLPPTARPLLEALQHTLTGSIDTSNPDNHPAKEDSRAPLATPINAASEIDHSLPPAIYHSYLNHRLSHLSPSTRAKSLYCTVARTIESSLRLWNGAVLTRGQTYGRLEEMLLPMLRGWHGLIQGERQLCAAWTATVVRNLVQSMGTRLPAEKTEGEGA